jgi:hypothetical protein
MDYMSELDDEIFELLCCNVRHTFYRKVAKAVHSLIIQSESFTFPLIAKAWKIWSPTHLR